MTLFPMILDSLKKQGASHILLFGGGIIADSDIGKLREMGIGEIFTPGATTHDIIDYLNKALPKLKKDEKII